MPLSPQQYQKLLEMTRLKISNWEISGWLMRTCGLRFQEASELRHQAIKECPNVTPKSQNQNPKENSIKAIEGWQKIGVETAKEKAPTVQPLQNETPDQTKIDVCDTCGDPTFSCDCSCKRLEEIPF